MDLTQATDALHALADKFAARIPYIGLGILVFLVFYAIGAAVGAAARRFATRTSRHYNLGLVLGRIGHGAIGLLGLLVALVIALPGFSPGQLVSVLGIGSVAIGFAFRDILQNFLAGILLLLSQPFRIGDQIRSGEFEGTVKEIQTRATFITTYDGRSIVIPNSTLFVNPVTVNTAYSKRRLEHDFVVGLDRDLEVVKRALTAAANGIDHVLPDPPPEALVVEIGKDQAKVRLRWWIEPPDQYELLNGLDDVLVRAKRAIHGAGGTPGTPKAVPTPGVVTASGLPAPPTPAEAPNATDASPSSSMQIEDQHHAAPRDEGANERGVLARLLRFARNR